MSEIPLKIAAFALLAISVGAPCASRACRPGYTEEQMAIFMETGLSLTANGRAGPCLPSS